MNNIQHTLTIGIPTYNRPNALAKVIKNLENLYSIYSTFSVLIVDDSSLEIHKLKNAEIIKTYDNNKSFNIDYYPNSKNLGFARSFIKILKHCKTDYLMLLADDDKVIPNHFKEILSFATKNKVALLSPQWLYKNSKKLGRGIKTTRRIEPKEFRKCSGHAPGLIINVSAYKKEILRVEYRLRNNCFATTTYPLVTFTAGVLLKYKTLYWYNKPLVMEGDSEPSNIKDTSGNHYSSINSRLQQIAAFDDMLFSLPESKYRDEMLFESRVWSIYKVLAANRDIRRELINRFALSLEKKIKRKISVK